MRTFMMVVLAMLLAGCVSDRFLVSKEQYREQVQTLGVLPLMVDQGSTIHHPAAGEVVSLVQQHNRDKADALARALKEGKGYFDVRRVEGDPAALFGRLVSGSVLEGEGEDLRRVYRFAGSAVADLAGREVVDALLVVIINGIEHPQKRWDRLPVTAEFLEARFNDLVATAVVVDAEGRILWELPGGSGEPFLPLQYPDFDEAYYNRSDTVRLKFLSLPGLDRRLGEVQQGIFDRPGLPGPYKRLFRRIDMELSPGLLEVLGRSPASG